jgi:hypothetical protein
MDSWYAVKPTEEATAFKNRFHSFIRGSFDGDFNTSRSVLLRRVRDPLVNSELENMGKKAATK